jgi:hypothetical protein
MDGDNGCARGARQRDSIAAFIDGSSPQYADMNKMLITLLAERWCIRAAGGYPGRLRVYVNFTIRNWFYYT